MSKVKNRWLIALAGVSVHLSIGSAYAWSIYTKPINELTGWSPTSISFAFSIAIFVWVYLLHLWGNLLSIMVLKLREQLLLSFWCGNCTDRCCDPSTILTAAICHLWFDWGIGLGSGYVTPVSTMIRWFPDRRGLATGMAIMGFGFASLITSPIAQFLMGKVGISNTFYILGGMYFCVMFLASRYLEKPPKDWKPEGMVEEQKPFDGKKIETFEGLTANEAIRTQKFWMLWIMLFLNITCGIGIVSAASPMAQEMTGMSDQMAAAMVGIMGIFNGLGRLFWATISDKFGRPKVYSTIFIVNALALTALYFSSSALFFAALVCIIMTCYGAGFSIIPAYIGDVFGMKEVGAIHGYILTAWAAAGVVGPVLLSTVKQMTDGYTTTLLIFIVLSAIAFTVSLIMRRKLTQQ